MVRHTPGNSPAAVARRAGRVVRRCNAWKVREGLLTPKELRRWVRSVETLARKCPESFTHWAGVVK